MSLSADLISLLREPISLFADQVAFSGDRIASFPGTFHAEGGPGPLGRVSQSLRGSWTTLLRSDFGERQAARAAVSVGADPEDRPPQLLGSLRGLFERPPDREPAAAGVEHRQAGLVGTVIGDPIIVGAPRLCRSPGRGRPAHGGDPAGALLIQPRDRAGPTRLRRRRSSSPQRCAGDTSPGRNGRRPYRPTESARWPSSGSCKEPSR